MSSQFKPRFRAPRQRLAAIVLLTVPTLACADVATGVDVPADTEGSVETEDEGPVATASSDVAATTVPTKVDPLLCEEGEPTRPPQNGACEIDLAWESTKFISGQGISEGRGRAAL